MSDPRRPWADWIDVESILIFHDNSLHVYGGLPGPADPSPCIDATLGAAYTAELYIEGRKHARAGLAFAAYLMFYLALRHCFVEGNKRVAWLAAADVLAALGLGINASDGEAFEMMDNIIAKKIKSGDEVVRWLAPRLFALSTSDYDPESGQRANRGIKFNGKF